MPKNRTTVVTGGAGFIGSHLAEELLRRGYQVAILDDLSTGKMENIAPLLNSSPISTCSPPPRWEVRRSPELSEGTKVKVEGNSTNSITQETRVVEFVQGSVVDLPLLQKLFHSIDYVFHQAAIPSVPRSVANPQASHEANITGTLNVLLAARDNGVKKVMYASSSSVYGDTPTLPKREDMPPNPNLPTL